MRLASRPVSALGVKARGFTLVELLVVIAIIGILVALLLPAVQAAREAARRAQCQSQVKNVALAMLNYESAQGRFPKGIIAPEPGTAGAPPSIGNSDRFTGGWMTEILPYLEEQSLFDTFDFTRPIAGGFLADGNTAPNFQNIQARGATIAVLLCPSDAANLQPFTGASTFGQEVPQSLNKLGDNWARGNYAANAGPGSLSNAGGGVLAPSINTADSAAWKGTSNNPNWPSTVRGIVGTNTGVRIGQIVDGTSKTILLAEIRAGVDEGDPRGTWAFPLAGGSIIAAHGSGGDSNGPNNCLPVGKADDIGSALVRMKCSTEAQAECMSCNLDSFGFNQAAPRSLHVGGVMAANADGSVTFVSDDIETTGAFGPCCGPWDYLIMSADEGFGQGT